MTEEAPHDAVQGLAARQAAVRILEAALGRRNGVEEALSVPGFQALEPRDRAFARALTLATLRRLGPIDRALDGKLNREPPARVRNLLRLGVTQIFWMDVPAYAAVSASVALADKEKDTRAFKGLVNAVLRGLIRDGEPAIKPDLLAPEWLLARWKSAFGEAEALKIAAVIPEEPASDVTLKDPAIAEAIADDLEAEVLPGGTLRTPRRGDVTLWPGYAEGAWWIQDAAAAVPARLLDVKSGETALDLCAAPGGKTLQLAAAGATVVALDRSADRLKRLKENFVRMEMTAEVIAADAAEWKDERQFDAVLLDAPCSATGTFRRHPDVLWVSHPGDVAKLAGTQMKLLTAAADKVKPGGRLVYCVCSLEPEEGEHQVRAFLKRRPDFALAPALPGEGGAPEASLKPEGWLRILPHQMDGGIDGFFIARFTRNPD